METTLFAAAALALTYTTLAATSAVLLTLGVVLVAFAVAMSMVDIRWAWGVYFVAICASGAQTTIAGLTVRPEYFAAPVFVLALYAHACRFPSATNRLQPGRGIYAGAAGLVIVSVFSSALVAPEAGASLRMAVQLVVALLAVIPLCLVTIDIRFAVSAGTTVLSAIAVGSLLYLMFDPSRRVSGLAFEYNVMGSLCVGWLGVLYYFGADRTIVSRRVLAAAVPIVLALVLTSTRAAWVALAFILVFWAIRNMTKRPVAVVWGVLGAALGAFYLHEIYYRVGDEDTFLWRVVHVVDTSTGTGAYRLQIWDDAVVQILARDWVALYGTGLNSFPQFNPIDPTNVSAAYLSSMWLSLVYDVGAVGTAFFLVLTVSMFLATKHKWRAVPLFVGLVACTSITNIIWFAFPWTFLALVVNASLTARPPTTPAPRRPVSGAHRLSDRTVHP